MVRVRGPLLSRRRQPRHGGYCHPEPRRRILPERTRMSFAAAQDDTSEQSAESLSYDTIPLHTAPAGPSMSFAAAQVNTPEQSDKSLSNVTFPRPTAPAGRIDRWGPHQIPDP